MWELIAINIALFLAERLLTPKPPKRDKPTPGSFNDEQMPIASESSAIPVVWGTVRMDAVNVLWYGAPATREIVQGGYVVGHRYFLTLQYGLCLGPIDRVVGVEWDDLQVAPTIRIDGPPYDSILYSKIHLFGEEGGGGGIFLEMRAYNGTATQPPDSHLEAKTGDSLPGYQRLAYLVVRGNPYPHSAGDPCILIRNNPSWTCPCFWHESDPKLCIDERSAYLGHSTTLHTMAVEIRRVDQCNPLELTGGTHDIDGDANPANMLYEIINGAVWGLGIPDVQGIDKASFTAAAATLAFEEFGLSMILDDAREARQTIGEILRHIDGVLTLNPDTGLLQLGLIRADYIVDELPVFGPNEIRSLTFSRPSLDTLSNSVRVSYPDRINRYKAAVVTAKDLAGIQQRGEEVVEDVSYPGVSNVTLAQKLAARDLKVLSYPWARVSFTIDRSAWSLRQSSPFKLDWADLGISGMVCRVTSISPGDLIDGKITIEAIEDVFGVSWTAYGPIPPSGWEDPFQSE